MQHDVSLLSEAGLRLAWIIARADRERRRLETDVGRLMADAAAWARLEVDVRALEAEIAPSPARSGLVVQLEADVQALADEAAAAAVEAVS